jgi:hypothetical protein
MSLIVVLIVLFWLIEQILLTIASNYTYSTSQSMMPEANSNNDAPIINISPDSLVVAHAFVSFDNDTLPQDNIRQYFSGVYVQNF